MSIKFEDYYYPKFSAFEKIENIRADAQIYTSALELLELIMIRDHWRSLNVIGVKVEGDEVNGYEATITCSYHYNKYCGDEKILLKWRALNKTMCVVQVIRYQADDRRMPKEKYTKTFRVDRWDDVYHSFRLLFATELDLHSVRSRYAKMIEKGYDMLIGTTLQGYENGQGK